MTEKPFFIHFFLLIIFFICKIAIVNCILEIPMEFANMQNTMDESIIVDKNRLLVAKVKIGTPSKEFKLLLDSTSNMTWLASKGSNDEFPINNHYEPDLSTTNEKINKQFQINAGYYCKGNFWKDSFEFIENKKFPLVFGAADETKFNVEDIDGMIGLAYDFEDDTCSFLKALKESGVTDSLSFSISIDENKSTKEPKGKMYIGKHEDFSKKETVSVPLIFNQYKNYWVYNIESFGLNNTYTETKSEKTFQAIFDTASNVIVLPLQYFSEISNSLASYGCQYTIYGDLIDKTYKIACKNEQILPNFKLKLNGNTFILPKEYFFYKIEQIYYSRIIFNGQNCIIGTPFFYLFHTMFDKESKMLRFYPKNLEHIEYFEKGEEEKGGQEEGDGGNGGTEGNGGNSGDNDKESDEDGFKPIHLLCVFLPICIIIIAGMIFLFFHFNKIILTAVARNEKPAIEMQPK